jgi:hypothetical protein
MSQQTHQSPRSSNASIPSDQQQRLPTIEGGDIGYEGDYLEEEYLEELGPLLVVFRCF